MAQDPTLPVTEPTVDYEAEFDQMFPDQTVDYEAEFDEMFPEEQKPEEPGLFEQGVRRLTGTDVEDPISTTRMGAGVAGAITGAVIGSRVPPAPGPLGVVINPLVAGGLFSALGVIAGNVAPEYTMEAAEYFGVVDKGFRDENGLDPQSLRTVVEGEILLDLVTGGTFAVGQLAARKGSQFISGVTKEKIKVSEKLSARGIHLMPVQFGNKTIAKGYVAVLGRFPLIGSPIRKQGQKIADNITKNIQNIPSRFSSLRGFNEVSEQIFTDATSLFKEMSETFSKRYEDIYSKADSIGVYVRPEITVTRAKNVIKRIAGLTPAQFKENPNAGEVLEVVKKFLSDDILSIEGKTKSYKVFENLTAGSSKEEIDQAFKLFDQGQTVFAGQSLRQMDGLLGKIDQKLSSFEPGQKKFAMGLLQELKIAAKTDVISNLKGEGAEEIGEQFLKIDKDFSHTMASVFETANAKRFGSVSRKGLKGATFDKATTQNIDKLAQFVIDMKSPQSIEELSRLVQPKTFKAITAGVLDDVIQKATKTLKDGTEKFEADKFIKNLGLDSPNSPKYKVIKKMLEKSGNLITMEELRLLGKGASFIAETEVPNVSSFVTRRVTLGGMRSLITTFLPFTAGVASASFGVPSLMAGLSFLGGSRLISKIISDPSNARLLKSVINEEASLVTKRKAWTQLIRLGASASFSEQDSFYREEGVPKVDFDDQGNAFSIDEAKKKMKQAGEEFIEAVESMTTANEE
jgi:hypothetical protein